jgi:MFS family permease
MPSRAAILRGSALLLVGLALTFFAIATTTSATFLAGTAVTGAGFGLAFLGTFRITTAQAAPGQSAGLVTAVFVVAYLAFSIPALIAGVGTTNFGLQPTALGYCAALAVLIAAAAGILLLRREQPPRPTQSSWEVMPPGPCTCPPCLRSLEELAR